MINDNSRTVSIPPFHASSSPLPSLHLICQGRGKWGADDNCPHNSCVVGWIRPSHKIPEEGTIDDGDDGVRVSQSELQYIRADFRNHPCPETFFSDSKRCTYIYIWNDEENATTIYKTTYLQRQWILTIEMCSSRIGVEIRL